MGMYSHNSCSVTGGSWCGENCMWQCLLGKITFLTGSFLVLKDIVVIGEAEDKDSALV